MKKLITMLCLMAGAGIAAPSVVWYENGRFLTITNSGGGTNAVPYVSFSTNFLYYADTTNYVFQSADLTNSYITRCSNGVVNVKTNSLLP